MPRRNNTPPRNLPSPKGNHPAKRRFASKSEAELAIAEQRRLRPEAELRAYRCVHCHGWHLTSRQQKDDII